MTDRGTFIINGVERTVVNQLVRSPGVFFTSLHDNVTGKKLYTAEIRPIHGSWLEFSTTRHETITVKIDRRRKFWPQPSSEQLDFPQMKISKSPLKIWKPMGKPHLLKILCKKMKQEAQKTQLSKIFKKMHPGEPVVFEKVKENFDGLFFNSRRYDLGKVGRYKVNKKLDGMPDLQNRMLQF